MRLALRELRRRPGRFVVATALLTLVALLLLFLGGLLDGLLFRSTAAIEAQRGDVLVFSSTSKVSFIRSRIDADLRAKVAAAPGVTATGGLGVALLGGRVDDPKTKDLTSLAVFGYEQAPKGVPEPPAAGQGYADTLLEDAGVKKGSTVYVGPARTPLQIIGFVSDTPFSAQGSVWVAPATWRSLVEANRPGERLGEGTFQVLVVSGTGGATALAGAIDAATGGLTNTLTVHAAARAQPGVKEQEGTFNQIIGVTIVIAVVVVALFFALLTVERVGLYGVLKAVGASTRTLFAGLVAQAVVVTLVAAAIAIAVTGLAAATGATGSLPFTLLPSRLVLSVALLLVAAVLGCVFSLRRVLRVDPASAIGSGT
jgi:putative ABC transport system permease protein